MIAIAVLAASLVVTIVGAECLRRLSDRNLLVRLADITTQHIDQLHFLNWEDMRGWYEELVVEVVGLHGAELEPLEAVRALQLAAERVRNDGGADAERKEEVIRNAFQTLPTTFDCYRFHATGRALIAAAVCGVLALGNVGSKWILAAGILLGLLLLSTLSAVAGNVFATLRLYRSGQVHK